MLTYFNIRDRLKTLSIEINGKKVYLCIAPRRIGKTTSSVAMADDVWTNSNYTDKVLILRNTMEEIKELKDGFNGETFRNKYRIIGNSIFKVDIDPVTGKEFLQNRRLIGKVGSLSTFANKKSSIESTNYKLILYDEFNSLDEDDYTMVRSFRKNQFFTLLEAIASYEGASDDLLLLIIGNKVDASNDILLELGIENQDLHDEGDVFRFNVEGFDVVVENVSQDEFKELFEKKKILAKGLASLNMQTNAYFNEGKFLKTLDKRIRAKKNFKDWEVTRIIYKLNDTYILEKMHDDVRFWEEIHMTETMLEQFVMAEYVFISLDNNAWLTDKYCRRINKDELLELAELMKEELLIFSSRYVYACVKEIFRSILNLIEVI